MPCFVDNKIVNNLEEFLEAKSCLQVLKVKRQELISSPLKVLDSTSPALYIKQNEFSILKPGQDNLEFLGTDEATTCNILIFRHSSNGVASMAHLDGNNTQQSICHMFQEFKKASSSGPEGRYEVHMIGGFNDERFFSIHLVKDIIDTLCAMKDDIYVVNSCICDENDVLRGNIHYPIVTGVALHMATGQLLRVQFAYKGPDSDIRSAACSSVDGLTQIYRDGMLRVGPYYWKSKRSFYRKMLQKDDNFILHNLSTSPEQESADFVPAMRAQMSLLVEHPNPSMTLFKDGNPRIFKWSGIEKQWLRVYE